MITLLAVALGSCIGLPREDQNQAFAPAAPEVQDVAVEHGDPLRPASTTLCETPRTFIPFERPIERQVYDVVTAYKTGLTDTLERLVAKTIVAEAERYDLDPWLVVGVIRVESRFYNFAESNKGARGLMQLLPDTGEELANDLGVSWTTADSLYNPVKNVKLGVAYLAILNRRFGGDWDKTLAAYNMGPGRVRQWLADGRDLPTGYASLCQEYQGRLRRIVKRHAGGDDLRGPITMVERSMARKHSIIVVRSVADVDPAQDGVATEASVPGLLAEPAIDRIVEEAVEEVVETPDGGLADALIAEEARAEAADSGSNPEPAIVPAAE